MSDKGVRHALNPAQRKRAEELQQNAQVAGNLFSLYLQGILDGVEGAENIRWKLENGELVGEKPDVAPAV